MSARPIVEVVVALLGNGEGRWLLNQRPTGRPLAGYWEFPGGKREQDEEPWVALRRELAEELGIEAEAGRRFLQLRHDYPERSVHLDVWRVTRYRGEPVSREQQALSWLSLAEIASLPLLEADWPIVAALERTENSAERE